jgi:hypothetical protein
MMDKHTPGPWTNIGVRNMMIDGRCHRIVNPEGYPSAFVPAWDRPEPGQENGAAEATANANLISAAPDLLAALEAMRDNPTIAAVCPSPLWAQMVDAILKARGETA